MSQIYQRSVLITGAKIKKARIIKQHAYLGPTKYFEVVESAYVTTVYQTHLKMALVSDEVLES